MVKLICKQVKYYSHGDEFAFDDWLASIKGIEKIEYSGDSIILYVRKNISQRALLELVALFTRYKIEMTQLAQFLNEKNKRWLTHWHQIFEKSI